MFRKYSLETAAADMGLVAGGPMCRETHEHGHGIDARDQGNRYRCFIHLAIACNNGQPPDIDRHINRRLSKIT
jgi:hypothetical protein